MVASATFGVGYGLLREHLSGLRAPVLGALYGAGLYVMNIVGIAPLLGMTDGKRNAPGLLRAERLVLHLLYGMLAASIAERAKPAGPKSALAGR